MTHRVLLNGKTHHSKLLKLLTQMKTHSVLNLKILITTYQKHTSHGESLSLLVLRLLLLDLVQELCHTILWTETSVTLYFICVYSEFY